MSNSYTPLEIAKLLEVSVSTVYSYERSGLLKRESDPHHLKSSITFPKEQVDKLKEEKEALDKTGISISELSKKIDVNPATIKEAIDELQLDVPMVRYSIKSDRKRYSITPEQERQLEEYLKSKKTTRAKRNHLYYPSLDLALYQPFLIAGEQRVRLILNDKGEAGFKLDNGDWVSYMNAVLNYDIEPLYTIHKEKQRNTQGFSDILVPTGKKAFYQILDAIYNVCGVENFNADFHQGNLVISVRNGTYPSNYSSAAVETIQQYLNFGGIEVKDNFWHFFLTKKQMQVHVDAEDYSLLKDEAEKLGISLKDFLESYLKEKANQLSK